MTDFDVFARVRTLLDETNLSDPGEIAEKLLPDLTRAERAAGFAQILPIAVSVIITRGRSHPAVAPAARAGQTRAQRIAAAWQAELRQRYRGAEGWRMLGEFTRDDHLYAAGERRARAATLVANAEWHEQCAEAMARRNAVRFDALPVSVLADLVTARRPE